MTPLQLHALALAQAGEHRLADALELLERILGDDTLVGIAHAPGGLALLAHVDAGRQDQEPDPWNDWEDPSELASPSDVDTWRTLDGQVHSGGHGGVTGGVVLKSVAGAYWLNIARARELVCEWERLVHALTTPGVPA